MSVIRVPTSFNIDLEFEMAEFHRRLFAWMIDLVIQFIYLRIIWIIFLDSIESEILTNDSWMTLYAARLLMLLPIFFYHPVCEILMNGQSLGKRIFRIRVVDEDGGRPSFSQFLIRWLIRAGDWAIVFII